MKVRGNRRMVEKVHTSIQHLSHCVIIYVVLPLGPSSFFFKCIYFWLCWVFVAAYRLFLIGVSRGYFLVAVHGLLIAVASLAAEHGLQVSQVQQSWCTGLVALRHVESSWTRDGNCVPCFDRWTPNHWTTREVLD